MPVKAGGAGYGPRVPLEIKLKAAILYKKTYETTLKSGDECAAIVNQMLGIKASKSSLNRWVDQVDLSDKTGKKQSKAPLHKTIYTTAFKNRVVTRYDELMGTDMTQVAAVCQINRELDCEIQAPNILYWKKQQFKNKKSELIGMPIYYDDDLGMMRIEGSQLIGVGAIETEPAAVAVV